MWFLTADPVVCIPMVLTELPERKNCGSFFKKHNRHGQVQFFDKYRGFFSCLHLAVGRHQLRRIPRCPRGLQLGRVEVCLADHMHTSYGLYHKLSFLRLFCWCSREYTFLRGKVECSLVFSLSLYVCLAIDHALPRAHRCCRSVSSWDLSSNFTAWGLHWRGILTCIFPSDGPFFPGYLLDVAWTVWIVLVELVPKLFASGFPETVYLEKRVHLNLVTHNPIVIDFSQSPQHSCRRFLFFLGCRSFWTFLFGCALWRMPIFTRRSRAGTFQIISARLSNNGPMLTFASDNSLPRHTSTSWCGWLRRCGCSVFWFLRTIMVSWRKLQRSPCEHWPFSFHWKQIPFPPSTPDNTFRLFNAAPDSIFPCLAPKFRKRSSDLFYFSPWFLLLVVGNRYLLMNLHVVPLEYVFELIRLT